MMTLSSSPNLQLWTPTEIAEAINGRIIKPGQPGSISSDTRTLQPGQWFLPLVGPNHDAHTFITPHLPAAGVIGRHVCQNWNSGFIQYDDTNTSNTLKRLALYARNKFQGRLVAVTGSVGKTTTKAMIALALSETAGCVYQSAGNWNNEIGVALSLIGMPREAEYGVLELGMSHKGEILELCEMCRPNVRVVLNVGAAHLENFASYEEVALAKGEILEGAVAGDDICVLNADDLLVASLPVPRGVKKVLFGRRQGCDVRLVLAQSVNSGLNVQIVLQRNGERVNFVIPCPGRHLALNACAAAAVATSMGVPLAMVGESLSRFNPVGGRSELVVATNGIKIINDAYNANPVSTKCAIDLLMSIDCRGKRVAILGDMLELGPTEIKLHEMILSQCIASRIDLVVLVGERYVAAAHTLKVVQGGNSMLCGHDSETSVSEILQHLCGDDVVLVKGSRGMKMESIVRAIKSYVPPLPCI